MSLKFSLNYAEFHKSYLQFSHCFSLEVVYQQSVISIEITIISHLQLLLLSNHFKWLIDAWNTEFEFCVLCHLTHQQRDVFVVWKDLINKKIEFAGKSVLTLKCKEKSMVFNQKVLSFSGFQNLWGFLQRGKISLFCFSHLCSSPCASFPASLPAQLCGSAREKCTFFTALLWNKPEMGEKNLQEFWFGHCGKEWATTSAGVRQGIKKKKKTKLDFHCLYNYHRELLVLLWLVIIKIKLEILLEEECWAGSGVPAGTWVSQGSRMSIFSSRADFTFISQIITYGQELCRKWWVEQLKPQITVTFYN